MQSYSWRLCLCLCVCVCMMVHNLYVDRIRKDPTISTKAILNKFIFICFMDWNKEINIIVLYLYKDISLSVFYSLSLSLAPIGFKAKVRNRRTCISKVSPFTVVVVYHWKNKQNMMRERLLPACFLYNILNVYRIQRNIKRGGSLINGKKGTQHLMWMTYMWIVFCVWIRIQQQQQIKSNNNRKNKKINSFFCLF